MTTNSPNIERESKPAKRRKYKTNVFYHYANMYRHRLTSDEEIEKIDFTDLFWEGLFTFLETRVPINININGYPGMGKSTAAFAIAQTLMKSYFKKDFDVGNIDRDQQEFSKNIRDPQIKETVRVIDEWNELETTGENSTIEASLFNYFSDVMGQRFIHKISCSPKVVTDRNSLVHLEVFSTEKEQFLTHCKLYYNLFSAGMDQRQLIGTVSISVRDIINKPWYKEYRRRKFEKMNLLVEEGIFRPRILDYAEVILSLVEKLRKLCKFSSLVKKDIIRNYVKMYFKKHKIPQTILGEDLATREVLGILDMFKEYYRVSKELVKSEEIITKLEKTKETHKETINLLETKYQNLFESKIDIYAMINDQLEELRHYVELNKKYNTIDTQHINHGMVEKNTQKEQKEVNTSLKENASREEPESSPMGIFRDPVDGNKR